MKLKTSFFDPAVLKKDFSRFLPLWLIYGIGGVLISQSMAASERYYFDVTDMLGALGTFGIINMGYALVVALMLYGDLFKSRMCNALHAMPVRREGLFLTHAASALLMSMVPNLIISIFLLPHLGQFWYAALLWWLGMTAQYLFFLGLAIFCIFCAGNAFAAVAMYGLFNLLSVITMWFYEGFYQPILYGVHTNVEHFTKFSPVVWLIGQSRFFEAEHVGRCANSSIYHHEYCNYEFKFYSEGWWYVLIIAGVGLVLAGLALLLYRKRHLESAGDFVSFKPMRWVFTVLASVSAGGLFYLIGFIDGDTAAYFFMFIGLLVGFFACQMLLERTVKVFTVKNLGKFGILFGAILLSFLLTALDPIGITRRIPKVENIQSVTIAQSHLSEYSLGKINEEQNARGVDPSYRNQMLTLTEKTNIRQVIQIHQLLLDEGNAEGKFPYSQISPITIHYILTDGTTLTRYYYAYNEGEAMEKLQSFTQTPEYILGVSSAEELKQNLQSAWCDLGDITGDWMLKLADALYADAEAGNLRQDSSVSHLWIELSIFTDDGGRRFITMTIPERAKHTWEWYKEYQEFSKSQ